MQLPYQLNTDSDTGLIHFTTDNGVVYYCRFQYQNKNLSPILGVYDLEIHEFDFYENVQNDHRKHDGRVSTTLCDLIKQYFAISDKRVMVYVCDGIDEKQRHRKITFAKWHNSFFADYLEHIPLVINIDGFDPIYGGVFIRIDFPHKDILNQELINQAEGIVSKKIL